MVSGVIIKDVVQYLQDKISCMELYQTVHGLVKQITDADGKMFPAAYIGNGKYSPLEYSQSNGMVYFRKNGDVSTSISEPDIIACEKLTEYTIPLKIISFIKIDRTSNDDSFFDDAIAQTIDRAIGGGGIKIATGSKKGTVTIESYSTDRVNILDQEYNGIERKDFNLDYSYLSINVVVKLVLDKNCVSRLCYGEDYCSDTSSFVCATTANPWRQIIKYTDLNVNAYTIPALNGKEIISVQLDNMNLIRPEPSKGVVGQYSLVGSTFTLTDVTFDIMANQYLNIIYK